MDQQTATDPANILNAHAIANGWPTRYATTLEFEQPILSQLAEVWLDKAAGRTAPHRHELSLRTLKPALGNLVILEREAGPERPRFRLRLVGSQIVSLFSDHTGAYLDAIVPEHLLPRWETLFAAVLDHACPLRVISPYDHPRVDYLSGESFLAPMLDASGRMTMILTATYFSSRARDTLRAPLTLRSWGS